MHGNLVSARSGRSVLKLSLGISSFAIAVIVAAVFVAGTPEAYSGTSYTLTGACPAPCNWSDTTKWSPTPPAGGPGQTTGDTANMCGVGINLLVDVSVPNPVIFNFSCTTASLTIPGAPGTNSLTLQPSSSMGSGGNTININGGNLTINNTAPGTLTGPASMSLNSGSLTLTGNVNLSGVFTFTGGTITGGGTLTVPVGFTDPFSGATGAMTISGATIDTFGTVNFASATNALAIDSGGHIKVESGGNLNLAADAAINSDAVSSPSIDILSGGTMTKNGGTSNTIAAAVNNAGTISVPVTGRTLVLNGGGTHTGAFNAPNSGSGFTFGGSHVFNAGWTWTAPAGAIFHVSSGTSTFNGTATIASLVQDSSTTIAGTALIRISSDFAWNGGTQSGLGTTSILAGATVNATAAAVTLDAGRLLLLNSGATFNVSPSGNVFSIDNGANVNVSGGTLALGNVSAIQTNTAATSKINLSAAAALNKTGAGITTIAAGLNSSGSSIIAVSSGGIALAGGSSTFNQTTIDLTAAGTSFEFGGSALYQVDPGTTTVLGTSASTLRLVNSATLQLVSSVGWPIAVTFLQDNTSILQSPGGIIVNSGGVYNFNGGTMDASGAGFRQIQVNTGGTLNFSGTNSPKIVNAWVISNAGGTINYNPGIGGGLAINSNAALQNSAGSLFLQNSNGVGITSDGTGTITNLGTITKSGTGISRIDADVSFSGGTLTTSAGTLVFNGPGLSQGISSNITAGAGTTIEFRNGSIGWSGVFGGPGTYLISTGTVVYGGSFTAPPVVTQTGGDLTSASGSFTVGSGSVYNWNGGTIGGPSNGGAVTINGGSLAINTASSGVTLDNATLHIGLGLTSNATWTGGNPITMQNNAPIALSIGGMFDIQGTGSINCNGCTTTSGFNFVSGGGTLQKSVSAGVVTMNVPVVINGGTLKVLTGGLDINYPSIVTSNGTFDVAAGAVLGFPSGTYQIQSPSTFNAPGTVKINGATLNINVSPAPSIGNIDLESGSLGIANVSTTNSFVWNGGSLNGSALTIAGGTATLSGANGAMDLGAFLITNSGTTATYNSPTNRLNINYPGGSITNSGTFTLATAQPITLTGTPPAGTFLFQNNGTLNGNGTINVGVSNSGNLNPGTSPGSISINESTNGFTQTSTGVFNVDLDGPATPGTTYDVLNVNGPVTLNGTLNTITGYSPASGDTFTPLSFTSRTGDFATSNLTFPGGSYTKTYTGTTMVLAATVPVNLAVSATGPPTGAAGSTANNYTVNVQSNATGAAPTHQVNLTLSSGSITSAAGAGYTCTLVTTTSWTCSYATPLAPPATTTITVTTTAPPQPGTMTLTAVVSTTVTETTLADNTASVTTTVTALADMKIGKTAGPLVAGQNVTYTLTVDNAGPSDATNVTIGDPTPAGLTFVSTSASCGTLPCNVGSFLAGTTRTYTVTFAVPANATGSVTNTATVSATETDPNSANNISTITTAITQNADLSVTKKGPASAQPGQKVTFFIDVTNSGPSNATAVMLNDASSRLTFNSATGACTAFPCSLGNMTAGQTATVVASYTVQSGTGTVSNTATVTSSTADANSANNSATVKVNSGCPTTPGNQSPADGATSQPVTGILQWQDVGATSYNVFLGPAGTGCNTLFATVTGNAARYADLQPGTTYEWRVEAVASGCTTRSSSCITFTTASSCPTTPPTLISPTTGTVTGPTTFTWSAIPGAKDYLLIVNGNQIAKTTAPTVGPVSVGNGAIVWSVVAEFDPPCQSLTSTTASFTSCDTSSSKTIASIVAQSDAGQTYTLSWDAVAGAIRYEVDESTDKNFTTVTTQPTTGTTLTFQHSVTTATAYYYRVRAFIGCANAFGPNSDVVRIVLAPVIALVNPNISAPAGSRTLIPIPVHINGFPDGTFSFTASLDPQEPWLVSVQPASGLLPPEGITLTVMANPTGLSNGTHTATVIVLVTTPSSKGFVANGVTPVNAPVSVSLTTPVTQKSSGPPVANSLIIPSTGHLDGINSRWASDVRILNTSSQKVHYQITFTPDDLTQGVKQTVIETEAGATTALDDVVKTWYGVGSLGESSNGSLEIRPLDNPAKTGSDDAPSISFTTVASSRTYNAAPNSAAGTLGEFIPAILFQNFVGKAVDANHAAQILSLQQIAQNDDMRTNFGVMEASGQPASVLVSVFDSAGKKLLEQTLSLSGGQHAQLNGFLAQNHIALNDGRIEAQVVGGDGKITAYASVIDNHSGDPILISGVPLGQKAADHFVLPGVADINTPAALWRTDMRVFNPTTSAQTATLTFYPLNGQGQPQSTSLTINAGEVKQLDNTLGSLFGLSNIGGAVHVQTATAVPLVISGRTFNQTSNGTFGQLTTAVTAADAIGKGDKPLQILQTESSVRQRTNVGIFEVTGKPATVEVTVFLPDSKFAPSTQIPLPANGFIQIPVIQSFGLTNVYNARVMMRVVDGQGRIGAYGSVIDQITQDPTYVPAQQ